MRCNKVMNNFGMFIKASLELWIINFNKLFQIASFTRGDKKMKMMMKTMKKKNAYYHHVILSWFLFSFHLFFLAPFFHPIFNLHHDLLNCFARLSTFSSSRSSSTFQMFNLHCDEITTLQSKSIMHSHCCIIFWETMFFFRLLFIIVLLFFMQLKPN